MSELKRKKKKKSAILDESRIERVEWVDIDSVTPWENNPRKNEQAIGKLAKLLKLHGQVTPIVVWSKDGNIYKGNTTWKAMKKIKAEKVYVMFYNFRSRAEATAYAIADNKSHEWSEWDDDVLTRLLQGSKLQELAGSIEDLRLLTGLSEKEYAALVDRVEMPDKLPDVDLSGIVEGKSDFMVLRFDSKEQMDKFLQKIGHDGKTRMIQYSDFRKKFAWRADE